MSKNVQWVVLIVVGGIAGLFIGELLAAVIPPGLIQDIISRKIIFGLNPPGTLDIQFFSLTLGFQLKITLFALLGIGLSFYIGRYL